MRTNQSRRAALITVLFTSIVFAVGDRHPNESIIYPDNLFFHNGGRIIDVKKAPFNAKGNGIADDAPALIAALDTVVSRLVPTKGSGDSSSRNFIIYLPKGTYLISKPIHYSIAKPSGINDGWEWVTKIRIIVCNRDSTIIRLRNSTTGFGASEKAAVLAFNRDGSGTNTPAENELRNITINTGSGNPGVVGCFFFGANACYMSQVSIISGDGSGKCGLEIGWSSQGLHNDLTIEGFDVGINVLNSGETNPTLEHVTLSGQKVAGIVATQGCPAMRSIKSVNIVPGLRLLQGGVSAALIESDFSGGNSSYPAIDIPDTSNQLFARDITIAGYTASVRRGSRVAVSGAIDEYVSGKVLALSPGQKMRSVNLPVEDAPYAPYEKDTSRWANVDRYPGSTDFERARNALNSGKSTIYFPKASYNLAGMLPVPSTVRHIHGLSSEFENAHFVVNQFSTRPILFECISGYSEVEQSSARTIILRLVSARFYSTTSTQSSIFIESCTNMGVNANFCPTGTRIWARSINCEEKFAPDFNIAGGVAWILGFKNESPTTCFEVTNGGILEALCGYRNECENDQGFPMIHNVNSHVSLTGFTNMFGWYDRAVIETRTTVSDTLYHADCPGRNSQYAANDYCIPLYVGYDSTVVKGLVTSAKYPGPAATGANRRIQRSALCRVFTAGSDHTASRSIPGTAAYDVCGRRIADNDGHADAAGIRLIAADSM